MKTTIGNLEIKGIKSFIGLEGYGFNATLYLNGKKVAFIIDNADGGEYYYDVSDKEAFKKIEDHIKTLPPTESEWGQLVTTLDVFIANLVDEKEQEKEQKKFEKKFQNCIIAQGEDKNKYSEWKLKQNLSLYPTAKLQEFVNKIKGQLKKGEKIVNTNLETLGITI